MKKTFYLGNTDKNPLMYNSNDLTTHAAIVGMTGSGKTGLAICLLEEAILNKIPIIAIDPKGDLANLMLTFPELLSVDFLPWVDHQEAAQKNITPEVLAENKAKLWRSGLRRSDQRLIRIKWLKKAADFQVYTPGSLSGIPVSILGSLTQPDKKIIENHEFFIDQVKNTAMSLLALLQINANPLKSKEFILLSSILETVWKNNDLDLFTLIKNIQTPSFDRVGMMDLESFYPKKDRFSFAVRINNLIGSPGFKTWRTGIHINAGKLLWSKTGKPQVSIFSIAHLSDPERMFFVSMLLNKIIEWMRTQSGSASLRAIVYMDEVFGYLPPVRNPPSKEPLLTLLKQARAFGLGIVLATQNPVDLDYKGLSNMGTWMIGRLQTERDKARLMDGLEGLSTSKKNTIGSMISTLDPRSFLMHNIHSEHAIKFKTRWTLSYLSGPMTLKQIERLCPDKPIFAEPLTRSLPPILHPDIEVYYALRNKDKKRIPTLIAKVNIHYLKPKWNLDGAYSITLVTKILNSIIPVKWSRSQILMHLDMTKLCADPPESATYSKLPVVAKNPKSYKKWESDLLKHITQSQYIGRYMSKQFKQVSKSGESKEDFKIRLSKTIAELEEIEIKETKDKYEIIFAEFLETVTSLEEQIAYLNAHPPSMFKAVSGMLSVALPRRSRLINKALGWERELDPEKIKAAFASLQKKSEVVEARFIADSKKIEQEFKMDEIIYVKVYPKKIEMTVDFFGLCWV